MLPEIHSADELCALVEEIGFLPYFSCGLPGFSVEDCTPRESWWNEQEPEHDPWEWRKCVAAQGQLSYGKFFGGRAGFFSKAYFPLLANYRRRGYDFDALWEEGLADRRWKRIMDLLPPGEERLSTALKRESGVTAGYDGAITALEMRTYLVVRAFRQRQNKHGGQYGWPVTVFTTPESIFGRELVCARYGEAPQDSLRQLTERCLLWNPDASREAAETLLR